MGLLTKGKNDWHDGQPQVAMRHFSSRPVVVRCLLSWWWQCSHDTFTAQTAHNKPPNTCIVGKSFSGKDKPITVHCREYCQAVFFSLFRSVVSHCRTCG